MEQLGLSGTTSGPHRTLCASPRFLIKVKVLITPVVGSVENWQLSAKNLLGISLNWKENTSSKRMLPCRNCLCQMNDQYMDIKAWHSCFMEWFQYITLTPEQPGGYFTVPASYLFNSSFCLTPPHHSPRDFDLRVQLYPYTRVWFSGNLSKTVAEAQW